jgi:thiamine-monophosphate kinase
MSEKKKLTSLAELGEFGLINHLTKDFKIQNTSSIIGISDDAAVLDYKGKKLVVTTDLLVEGIHFNLIYTPMKHLGYKAVVVNLSDVYAMNATPKQITVSIAVSGKFTVEALDLLYEGIRKACEHYSVDLIGGDTTSSVTGLTISVTAIGEVEEPGPVLRKTAKPNDLICVSGDLGAAYMGLQLLERERKIYEETKNMGQPDLAGYDYILERQLKPEAQKDIIQSLRDSNIHPTSMIDISDGLSSDLLHICRESAVGCRIFQDKIPIHTETVLAAEEMGIEPFICALNGGEDYELLFTIPLNQYDRVIQIEGLSVIGHINDPEAGCKFITSQENEFDLEAQGWNPI